jgi:CubicO group peptidase (beta-lactamase class C family)
MKRNIFFPGFLTALFLLIAAVNASGYKPAISENNPAPAGCSFALPLQISEADDFASCRATEYLSRRRMESAITALVNKNEIIPLMDLERGRFAFLEIGETDAFASRLRDYLEMPVISPDTRSASAFALKLAELEEYDRIIVGISATTLARDESFTQALALLIDILGSREAVIVFFGPADHLGCWEGIDRAQGLMLAGGNSDLVQDLSAQIVFGAIGAKGRLYAGAGNIFPVGAGLPTAGGLRFKYTIPEEAGLDSRVIDSAIDSIVNAGLAAGAFPGCQVFVAIGGKVIVDRAYGYHTYAGRVAVERGDLYDLASVTKISGPLPMYMKLVDEGLLDLDLPLSYYWDDWKSRLFRRSNKQDIILRDLLTHQAGIVPYINYYAQTIRGSHYKRRWYRPERTDGYSLELSSHLHLRDNFRERVYRTIRRSELHPHGEYLYSCLPFIVSPEVIAKVDGRSYTDALYEDFYRPLGAGSLRYNPREHVPLHRIVPTEHDNSFRRQLVHGYVHDEASAVLGGVSGNAGLFSTAGDLAKLLQMYLNMGEYGGRRYISEDVLLEFSSVQFPENDNRRGIGFDKPLLDNRDRSPERAYPAAGASAGSFGHGGFTGTFVWMDPEHDLLFVFLSNRVYPTRANNLLSRMNIRTDILQLFYDNTGTWQQEDIPQYH